MQLSRQMQGSSSFKMLKNYFGSWNCWGYDNKITFKKSFNFKTSDKITMELLHLRLEWMRKCCISGYEWCLVGTFESFLYQSRSFLRSILWDHSTYAKIDCNIWNKGVSKPRIFWKHIGKQNLPSSSLPRTE